MAKSANTNREQRILDAAAELFNHYGFDKTTVDDIARQAGISKGAVYLHFKSKGDLFEGLLMRELKNYAEKWLDLIDKDPKGGTIASMYKNSLYSLSSSPFMSVIFKRDKRVLGNYIRQPDNFFRNFQKGQAQSSRHEFVKLMQDAGAIRTDIDPKVIAHIMNILSYGLVGMDEIMDADDIPPTDDLIEGIAAIMDRALTPEGGGNPEAGKAIIKKISDAARQQFEQSQEPKQDK